MFSSTIVVDFYSLTKQKDNNLFQIDLSQFKLKMMNSHHQQLLNRLFVIIPKQFFMSNYRIWHDYKYHKFYNTSHNANKNNCPDICWKRNQHKKLQLTFVFQIMFCFLFPGNMRIFPPILWFQVLFKIFWLPHPFPTTILCQMK